MPRETRKIRIEKKRELSHHVLAYLIDPVPFIVARLTQPIGLKWKDEYMKAAEHAEYLKQVFIETGHAPVQSLTPCVKEIKAELYKLRTGKEFKPPIVNQINLF